MDVSLLNSEIHSDLTIKVGNSTFKAHKNILALRTDFFTTATKEGRFAESKDNTVTLQEHSANAVWRFLTYCYSGQYLDTANKDLGEGRSSYQLQLMNHDFLFSSDTYLF
jgi:hypothetical protein